MTLFGENPVHFAFDMSAVIVCITVLFFSLISRRTEKMQNKAFISLIIIIMLNSVCEIVTNYLVPLSVDSQTAFKLMDYTRLLYFLLHTALCPGFFFYVTCVCGAVSKFGLKQQILYSLLFIVTEVIVILNPFTHWLYHFDGNSIYHRDKAIYAIYIAAAVYFILALIRLLFSWQALTPRRRAAITYFMSIVVIGVVLQGIWVDMKVEMLAESFGLFGIMLAVENEDDRIDQASEVYNRKAFEDDLNVYILNRNTFHLFCIKITNADMAKRIVHGEVNASMRRLVAEYLREMFPGYRIYVTSDHTFVVTVFERDKEKVNALAEKISERFDSPWYFDDTEVLLNAVVMSANVPSRISSTSDALFMADSPVPVNTEKKILTDTDLDYLMRRAEVEKAITRGLEENNFEVYYQPTYYLKDRRLHGAEALIRLHDSVLGNVYPTEFIPIAEKMGLIDDLDDFVLGEVCRFIKTGIPAECGMDCINVNLSVIQCMRPGFVDRINNIVSSHGVAQKFINFEITETTAADDYRLLNKAMNALKRMGFLFSMDDYGTGYSNVQSIFSLDFDVIKIDKSILWSAEKGELGMIILENSVRMIKQMNRRILVEGVETEGQIELLKKIGVDYLQGYFFSRPIPKNEFIELIEKEKNRQ